MFRIAKNLVKTLEQSVQETLSLSQSSSQLDAFFQSIPPNLLLPQTHSHSQQDQEQPQHSVEQHHHPRRFNEVVSGLRVVYVSETQRQLQSYFDYIVGINDDAIPLISNQHGYFYPDYNQITQIFNAHNNNTIKLNIWSAKGGIFRDEYISVVSKDGTNLEDVSLSSNSMRESEHVFQPLGFKVQWTPLIASTFTYHVLNINLERGPAALAGLIPDEDYIIGCQDGLLATGGETLLQDIVRSRANHDLSLYVYNVVHDCVRPITVHIGGDGRLGCNVGYGFLHRIPTVIKPNHEHGPLEPSSPAADLEPVSSSTFVPSSLVAPASAKKTGTKGKKKHSGAPPKDALMSDYFSEGKDESAVSTMQHNGDESAVPPPPS
ncbi:hypothetical protein HG536_0B00490 [Torulaspora globosa]|uniref:PDZ GRASP-type domain-containing protein n=1 Tax=Torulaspora globosa TaxID=48254 RepID=A0A7G3ZCF2_9SACH|nr:uncharacterized protein HG536_0B00490 [Torulaspora globosa]QLL31188.1 hypothetical protein HG536_0B00490 [Torulaspora globosa]